MDSAKNIGVGKTILVTGASSGLGYAIAHRLSVNGHTVFGAARDIEHVFELSNEVGTIPIELDVTDTESIYSCVDLIADLYGNLDILINCDGDQFYRAIEESPLQNGRYQYDLGAFGLAEVTNAVIPMMIKQGMGTIINVVPTDEGLPASLDGWYSASNHAINEFSEALRYKLAPHNIDVTLIESAVMSSWLDDKQEDPEIVTNRFKDTIVARKPKPHYKTVLVSIIAFISHIWQCVFPIDNQKKMFRFVYPIPSYDCSMANTYADFRPNQAVKQFMPDFDDL